MTVVEREQRRYHEAMRILLEGVGGCNASAVGRLAGVSHQAVLNFVAGRSNGDLFVADKLAWVIWRKLNAAVLLSDEDRQPSV